MKKRNFFLFISLTFLLTTLGLVLWVLPRHPELGRDLLEQFANRSATEYFAGSLRIKKVSWDHHFKIHLTGITAKLKTRQNPVPLEIRSLGSQDSLFLLILQKPVRFTFEGLRPQGSSRPGISGTFMIRTGTTWHLECSADLGKTDLEDWQWLDPQNLAGATGAMRGNLIFQQTAGQEPKFSMDLEAPQPGGDIQARFFDLFLPYLPASLQKQKVEKISKSQKLVRYDQAALKVSLPQSDQLKILLQIFVPAYNLKLTLNVFIKTDQKDAFSQIAQLMGFIA